MFEWSAIYLRFVEGYEVTRTVELARLLGVTKQTVHSWKVGKSHVPWRKMKSLIGKKGLRWDWLLAGKNPKYASPKRESISNDFDWSQINRRFLSLYSGQTQKVTASQLGVAQETVSKWFRCESHVPWTKLDDAVSTFDVSWDWLLEGL